MNRSSTQFGICLLLLACHCLSFAGALEDGSDAIDREDFDSAYRLLYPLATQGNAFAQYNVGYMYSYGLGVLQNDGQAAIWYEKSALQGDPDAQTNFGRALEFGNGIERDFEAALKWYRRAAAQGNAIAQHNIGSVYFNGHGVTKDDDKAFEWYAKAADQDLAIAQNAMGGMYVNGISVEKDPNKGLEWIMKAANQGWPDAQLNAFRLYYRDAERGNTGAMHNAGYMCLQGWAGVKDPNKCITLYETAAERGYSPSAKALVQIYSAGLFGIPADAAKAEEWQKPSESSVE